MGNLYSELSSIMQQSAYNGSLYNRPDGRLCLFSFALKAANSKYDIDRAIEVTKQNLSIWHHIKMTYNNTGGIDMPCPVECFMTVEILNRILDFLTKAKEMVDYINQSAELAEAYQEESA